MPNLKNQCVSRWYSFSLQHATGYCKDAEGDDRLFVEPEDAEAVLKDGTTLLKITENKRRRKNTFGLDNFFCPYFKNPYVYSKE